MKKENQSNLDERIKLLNEQIAKNRIELDRRFEETEKLIKENGEQISKNGEQIVELGKQVGGFGNKFGGYTEAMARPSIRRILDECFEADYLGPLRIKNSKDAAALEVDVWGLSRNGTGAAYIVEIKSKFRDKHIKQIWKLVERFRSYRPDYEYRAVYPMLAAVDISEADRRKVWNAGIHLIDINNGVFKYAEPPTGFEANGYHGVQGMHGVQRGVPHLQLVVGGDQKQRGTG